MCEGFDGTVFASLCIQAHGHSEERRIVFIGALTLLISHQRQEYISLEIDPPHMQTDKYSTNIVLVDLDLVLAACGLWGQSQDLYKRNTPLGDLTYNLHNLSILLPITSHTSIMEGSQNTLQSYALALLMLVGNQYDQDVQEGANKDDAAPFGMAMRLDTQRVKPLTHSCKL